MPNLMDIFAGSDEVVRFEPVGPEDEEAAQQETDYVNHVRSSPKPACWAFPRKSSASSAAPASIKDCNYCFHEVVTKTEAQLIAEGFDEDQSRR
jgi:hypothetical protein